MTNLVQSAETQIKTMVEGAFAAAMEKGALPQGELPAYAVEIPADPNHGDFAVNAAMVSARAFRLPPRKIAEAVAGNISFEGTYFERCEIAGPGFINFFLGKGWFADAVAGVLADGDSYGRSDFGKGEKVMVEFVSANPTGPMHMGNARGGAIGDCLASALDFAGYEVCREFYVNDAGNQIAKFGKSLEARYLQLYKGEDAVEFPEDGYHGDDIKERAKEYADLHGDNLLEVSSEERQQALIDYALPRNVDKLKSDLEKYHIYYDVWFKESTLHASGAVQAAVDLLASKGLTYEKDGAIWYKATEFGGEKDEVLVRANGFPTYFAADIAYHYNKFAVRGFDRVINIWGADHHGHVARLKGAMDAIGLDGSKLDIVLMQLVRLTKNGEVVKMSKRTGKAITLTDLLEDVPVEAARFFFNMREPNSTLDFDLDLAVQETSQNPVYYVQYAHARICSLIARLAEEGHLVPDAAAVDPALYATAEEKTLIKTLSQLPEVIRLAARDYDPSGVNRYLVTLAGEFHRFYNACRIKGEEAAVLAARLKLADTVRAVIANCLSLIGVAAPEKM